MHKIEIFDPAMCCSTGVCGPSVDPNLTRVASAVYSLEKKVNSIKRYNLANDPAAFTENEIVNQVLQEKGADALPITLLDGRVIKVNEYPSNDEFAAWLNVNADELTEKPRIRLNLK